MLGWVFVSFLHNLSYSKSILFLTYQSWDLSVQRSLNHCFFLFFFFLFFLPSFLSFFPPLLLLSFLLFMLPVFLLLLLLLRSPNRPSPSTSALYCLLCDFSPSSSFFPRLLLFFFCYRLYPSLSNSSFPPSFLFLPCTSFAPALFSSSPAPQTRTHLHLSCFVPFSST